MTPEYPYEKRPLFLDRWLNWRNTRNRDIVRAPVMILTGAGASVPLGVPSLKLPAEIKLPSGISIPTKPLVPPKAAFAEELDLETLMIIASAAKVLPRDVVRHGMGSTPADKERHWAVLGFTISMVMPKANGKPVLSSNFVLEVIKRLIEIDVNLNGKVLDGLSDAINNLIITGCLQIDRRKIVPTYGPLLGRLFRQLSNRSSQRWTTVPVFTTNYDETFDFLRSELATEMAQLVSTEVAVFDGADPIANNPHWRLFRTSGYARYKPSRGDTKRFTLVTFPLHGSVRWSFSEKADPAFSIFFANADAARQTQYYRALLPPDGQKVLYGKSHQDISDLFAPERKDPFRPGSIFYPMRLGYLFLEKCLKHAKVVLAIGYSFRDSDCLELLMDRWKTAEYPKLLLLDPCPEPILARLAHSKNVIPIVGKFGEENIAARTDAELARHL